MGDEYRSLFENQDSKGFSITIEDLAITTIQQEVKDMLDLAALPVARISDKIELLPGYSLRELVLRCMVRKAYESMLAILDLARLRHSLPAMSLLRSMCEEVIFAKFIKSLTAEDAETYLHERSMVEVLQGLNAQEAYFLFRKSAVQPETMADSQLSEEQKELRKKVFESPSRKLKELGQKLEWERKGSPSVKYMARKTGSLAIYGFFYHAASSSVHASLHNLLRMVWGNPATSQFSITNMNYERYYRQVVITYGAILFSEIMETVKDSFVGMWKGVDCEAYQKKVAFISSYAPPIVTEEELHWGKSSNE